MDKRAKEQRLLNTVMFMSSDFNDYCDISDAKQDCPDFVLQKENQIVGCECLEIPTVSVNNQDLEQLFDSKVSNLYKRYKDIYKMCPDSVMCDIQRVITNKFNDYATHSFMGYINNCMRLLGIAEYNGKHMHNAELYIKELQEKYPSSNIEIRFILDIAYKETDLRQYQYCSRPDGLMHIQSCSDYPFTYMFVSLLRLVPNVNDFYIVWHPYDNYDVKDRHVRLYYLHFDMVNWFPRKSNIPKYWWAFDIPHAHKIGYKYLNADKCFNVD